MGVYSLSACVFVSSVHRLLAAYRCVTKDIKTFLSHCMLRISRHSVQQRENVDQNNSKYGHFSRSELSLGVTNISYMAVLLQLGLHFVSYFLGGSCLKNDSLLFRDLLFQKNFNHLEYILQKY